jgi:arylsulfatase A
MSHNALALRLQNLDKEYKMKKSILIQALFLAAILLTPAIIAASEPVADVPPNFVILLCDDLGYGDLGCFGHPMIKTPNLDQLALEGARLTDCYSTSPVCSASRAGLLTGRTPNRVGVYDWIPGGQAMHLTQDEITFATLLQGAGYATCQSGKWHCNGKFNNPDQPQPGDHGFDHWFATQNNASPSHANPRNFVRNGEPVGPLEGYSCRLVAREAIDWVTAQQSEDSDQPFCMFVCFHEPHEPIASPPELVEKYVAQGADGEGEALYYANVENMDRAVGDLTAALDRLGVADDTIVYFTSDNGPETLNRYGGAWRSWGSPGELRGMKLWIYEAGYRVPGIVRWPNQIDAGQTIAEPVCALDLLPTMCELADVELPTDRTYDGASLVSFLEGGEEVERAKPLYWHYHNALSDVRVAIRDGQWKLTATLAGDAPSSLGAGFKEEQMNVYMQAELDTFELYDLEADPSETNDLSEEHPAVLARMRAQIETMFHEVRDEGTNWWE